jgi:hypothetical protein
VADTSARTEQRPARATWLLAHGRRPLLNRLLIKRNSLGKNIGTEGFLRRFEKRGHLHFRYRLT